MTRDFHSDVRSLLGLAKLPLPFIGLMGSKAKITRIFEALSHAGVSPEFLSRIYAPAGLAIPSHTPEEIAISVAGQILQERERWAEA